MKINKTIPSLIALLILNTLCTAPDPHTKVKVNEIRVDTDSLKMLLEEVYANDQEIRQRYMQVRNSQGQGPALNKLNTEMMQVDSLNLSIVENFLSCYGFPSSGQFGENAPKSIFYVVQHSPLETQLKHYDMLKKAMQSGDVPGRAFAMFEDRVRMGLGQAQMYGTQISCKRVGDEMPCSLHELALPEVVDSLRAAIGLGPLAEYLDKMGVNDARFNPK